MKNNLSARQRAYSLLKEYGLSEPTLDDLVFITQRLGYEIIDFSQEETSVAITTLVHELGVTDLIKTSRAFVYQKGDVKLLFVDDTMTSDEKRYAIAHELGHIFLDHLSKNSSFSADMEEEFEANEFAHYLLNPDSRTKAGLWPHRRGNYNSSAGTGINIRLIAVLLIIITGLGLLSFKYLNRKSSFLDTDVFQMKVIDPFSFINDGSVFGKTVDSLLDNEKEGEDYSVTDVYGDQRVYSYALRRRFDYFGIHEGDTGIRIFTEAGEGITMICYDFVMSSADTDLITDKLQAMMACIRQVYKRGYDYGLYYDPQDNRKYISFDDFLYGIKQRINGSYAMTWAMDRYAVSLNFNYDGNQQISLGSIKFYIPRK